MASLSVVISAYNEEQKLAACLESVKWADEIIVVDNSSTDKTPKIAKQYKARVFRKPNNPMLNINKNYGISKAKSDWILYLDADEQVTRELKHEIKAIISSETTMHGYWIPRKNIIFGKWIEHTGMYPDYQMRLIRRGKGKFPAKHVHEMIEVEGETGYAKEHISHLNYETISQFIFKHAEIYSQNEMKILLKNGYRFSYKDAIRFPAREFLSRFFAREGYKDGLHGLVLSLLFSFYHLIIFARIWESEKFKSYESPTFLESVSEEFKEGYNELLYWVANERIKKSKSIVERYLLRVTRKIKS